MSDNGNKWDRNQILTLIGVIVAAATLVASVVIPEMRNCFGLKDGNTLAPVLPAPTPQPEPKAIPPKIETPPEKPAAATQQPPVVHEVKEPGAKPKPPSGPFSATLHENQPQFIEAAKTSLSIVFNKELGIVTLTIAPDGKQLPNRAVLNGYTEEFTSSTGAFLVHILNVDWESRTITVQVSRKL